MLVPAYFVPEFVSFLLFGKAAVADLVNGYHFEDGSSFSASAIPFSAVAFFSVAFLTIAFFAVTLFCETVSFGVTHFNQIL